MTMMIMEAIMVVEMTLGVIFSYTCNSSHNRQGYARIMMVL